MLYDALKYGLAGRLPMHMPGHKRNAALAPYLRTLGAALDITEIEGFDNLHAPRGLLRDAQERAAGLYGSHAAFFLVNGTTVGILAGIRALTKTGDTLLMDRASHLSVYHGAALNGLRPAYLTPPHCTDTGIPGVVTPALLSDALDKHPDARLLALTCPTFHGQLCDLTELVAIAHARGVAVLVDAAHGAHLGLHPQWPGGAVASGADLVVHSVHKTLPSLTQTALLHAGDTRTAEAAAEQLDMLQTTSPSYLLMASIDGCVGLLQEQGEQLLPAWLHMLTDAVQALRELRHLSLWQQGPWDPSKLVISCANADITGYALSERLLNAYRIDLEMAQDRHVLAMGGLGDTEADWRRFTDAVLDIESGLQPARKEPLPPLPLPAAVMPPHEALLEPFEDIPLPRAAGRVCGEYVVAYPPGSPVMVPGERVEGAALQRALGTPRLMKTRTKSNPGLVRVLRTVDKL